MALSAQLLRSRWRLRSLLVAFALAGLFPNPGLAGIFVFENAGDLSTYFSINAGSPSAFSISPTVGVGGSGGVISSTSAFSTESAVSLTGADNSIGSSIFVSIDYQMKFQSDGPDVRVGFTTTSSGTFDGPNDIWAETLLGSSPKLVLYDADGTPNFVDSVPMTEDNWFRLRLDLTKSTATDYSGTISLFDLGATGLVSPIQLSLQSISFSSSSIGAAPLLYPGFFLMNSTTAADNFTVPGAVPEPSSALLVIFAGYGLVGSWRRNREAR